MSKKLLSILILSLLFYSCTDERETTTLDLFLEENKIKPQLFYVSTDSIIRVIGKKGTTLIIDPNTIDFQNGEMPKEIRVELIELTTTEELLRNNVQTVSNGKWLISGGSFKINLFEEEKPLSLKNGKTISAVFPKLRNEKMQLFYGERGELGAMNWEPENQFFEEGMYFGILNTRLITVDEERNSRFRITRGYYLEDIVVDTLGYSNLESHRQVFEERGVDSVSVIQDTIKGYLLNAPPEYIDFDRINGDLVDDVLSDTLSFNSAFFNSNAFIDNVYQSIEINKLGWINIDRFYPEIVDRVACEITFNTPFDHLSLYVLDRSNNTVVNIFPLKNKYTIDLPIDIEFSFIAVASEGVELYSSKKTIQVQGSKVLKMNMKKVNETDLANLFK